MKSAKDYFLMLESDADDRMITAGTLKELDIPVNIEFLRKSDELFPFLQSQPRPKLILLNSNTLPDDGLTVLRHLKNSPYASIPVGVLSDSATPDEVDAFYREGAISFIEKPYSLEETQQKIRSFFDYWLQVAEV